MNKRLHEISKQSFYAQHLICYQRSLLALSRMVKAKNYRLAPLYLPLLKRLKRESDANRKKFFSDCPREIIECCCEIARNIINRNIPMNENQFKKIHREAKNIKELARVNTPLNKKRRILQIGGFLPMLLGPLIGIASNLLGGLFGGR